MKLDKKNMPASLTLTRSQVSAWSGYLDRRTQAGSVESLYKSNAARHFYVKLEIKTFSLESTIGGVFSASHSNIALCLTSGNDGP